MRNAIGVLFVIGVVAACGSKTPTSPGDDDSGPSENDSGGAGSSSGSSGGGSPDSGGTTHADSGLTPDNVLCPTTNCNLNRSQTCCIKPAIPAVFTCVDSPTACPANTAHFSCQQATDCDTGSLCCGTANTGTAMAGATCQTTCPTTNSSSMGQAQFCKTDSECKDQTSSANQHCIAQACVLGTPPLTVTANFSLCGLQMGGAFNCTMQ